MLIVNLKKTFKQDADINLNANFAGLPGQIQNCQIPQTQLLDWDYILCHFWRRYFLAVCILFLVVFILFGKENTTRKYSNYDITKKNFLEIKFH